MKDFLPEQIRDAVRDAIMVKLDSFASGYVPRGKQSRVSNSQYILKGILKAKHDGGAMVGKKLGSHHNRYYYRARSFTHPGTSPTKRRYVPAEPIEKIVIQALQKALLSAPMLRGRLHAAIENNVKSTAGGNEEIEQIRTQRGKVEQQFDFITENLGLYGPQKSRQLLEQARVQLDDINRRLAKLENQISIPDDEIKDKIDRLIQRLTEIPSTLEYIPRQTLARLLQIFVAKAEVDIDSRHLELEFRIPRWMLDDPDARSLKGPLAYETTLEASASDSLPLLRFRIFWLGLDDALYLGFGTPGD